MLEKQQENQQQPKNDNGKRLFYVILVALSWLLFVFGLLFASSKCAKAGTFMTSNNVSTGFTYNEGQPIYNYTYSSYVPYAGFITTTPSDLNTYDIFIYEYYSTATPPVPVNMYARNCTYTAGSSGGSFYCTSGLSPMLGSGLSVNSRSFTISYVSARMRYELVWSSQFNNGANTNFYAGASGYTQADINAAYQNGMDHSLEVMCNANNLQYCPSTATDSEIVNQINTATNNGYTTGVNAVTSDPNDYNLYSQAQYNSYGSSQYNAGYSAGESAVTSNPNDYNLYTSTQYNDYGTQQYNAGYSAGQSADDNYTEGYSVGQLDMLNYFSETYGSGTIYSYTGTGSSYVSDPLAKLNTEVNVYYRPVVRDEGRLSVLNYVSNINISFIGQSITGSTTQYVSYTESDLRNEIRLFIHKGGYVADNDLLNALSGQVENGGTGTIYNINNSSSFDQRYVYLNTEVLGWVSGMTSSTYTEGYTTGTETAYNNVSANPSAYGYITISDSESAVASARASGYTQGYHEGINNDSSDLPSTIIAIASVPYTVLTSMFNFNVLGLNIFVFVTSLMSLAVVIWVIKKLWK